MFIKSKKDAAPQGVLQPPALPENALMILFQYYLDMEDTVAPVKAKPMQSTWKTLATQIWSSTGKDRTQRTELPDEILQKISNAVQQSGKMDMETLSDPLSIVQVCQEWHKGDGPRRYQDLVIDVNYHISTKPFDPPTHDHTQDKATERYAFLLSEHFYDASTKLWLQPWKEPGVGFWVRRLSIMIHFQDAEGKGREQSITDLINVLPNVRTLSIRAAPLRLQNYILRRRVIHLLRRLPERIVNLEVDLQGRDTCSELDAVDELPSCEVLGSLLPQLHNLRLRLATLCPNFLDAASTAAADETEAQSCPKLKSLSLSLYTRDFHHPSPCCSVVQTEGRSSDSPHLIDMVQSRIDAGTLFPNLKACALVCLRQDQAAPATILKNRIIVQNLDVATKSWEKRSYFPQWEASAAPWFVRTDANGDVTESVMHGVTEDLGYGQPGVYVLKKRILAGLETDALFEGKAAWREDEDGARFPSIVV